MGPYQRTQLLDTQVFFGVRETWVRPSEIYWIIMVPYKGTFESMISPTSRLVGYGRTVPWRVYHSYTKPSKKKQKKTPFQENPDIAHPDIAHPETAIPRSPTMKGIPWNRLLVKVAFRGVFQFGVLMANLRSIDFINKLTPWPQKLIIIFIIHTQMLHGMGKNYTQPFPLEYSH